MDGRKRGPSNSTPNWTYFWTPHEGRKKTIDGFHNDVIKSQDLLNFYRKKVDNDLDKLQLLWGNDVSALIHKSAKTSWPLDPPADFSGCCLP